MVGLNFKELKLGILFPMFNKYGEEFIFADLEHSKVSLDEVLFLVDFLRCPGYIIYIIFKVTIKALTFRMANMSMK
jgi:hypothetical protein